MAADESIHRHDILFLPLEARLARHNKLIFGTLFLLGALYAFAAWLSARGS